MTEREMVARRMTAAVLNEVRDERVRQDALWGVQSHPDGTGGPLLAAAANEARARYEAAEAEGRLTYGHILAEEVAEAFAEADATALRKELIQVAAVAVAWVEKLDREAAVLARAGGLCDACGWEEWKHKPRVLNVVGQELCAGFVAPRSES